ncbi:MAG: hypothetical protein MJ247_00380 [Alphaproteobacteria bacterium]|nr:hypothetical protein [Alphaproteobacteria bacterium]
MAQNSTLNTAFSTFGLVDENEKVYEIDGIVVKCPQEKYEMAQKFFKSLSEIPTGRNALDDIRKYNTPVAFLENMGKSAGSFSPTYNRINLNMSVGYDKMRSCLVHEARHLWQDRHGRSKFERHDLDYETSLIINRATEADAQSQGYQACLEWEQLGDKGPKEVFDRDYAPIAEGYKKDGIAGAYRGWYDDERITAAYENGYDMGPAIRQILSRVTPVKKYIHASVDEIKEFCGGDKVPNFEEFVTSDYAKRVHSLTQAILLCKNAVGMTMGCANDNTVAQMPLRDMKDNAGALMYSEKYATEKDHDFYNEARFMRGGKKSIYDSLRTMIAATQDLDKSKYKGNDNLEAKQTIKDELAYIYMAKTLMRGVPSQIIDKVDLPENISKRLKENAASLKGSEMASCSTYVVNKVRRDLNTIATGTEDKTKQNATNKVAMIKLNKER